jgi:hypothetical protein
VTDQSKFNKSGITPVVGNPFAEFVPDADLNQPRNHIRFKQGTYVDQDKQSVALGTSFIAVMVSLSTGYGEWLETA